MQKHGKVYHGTFKKYCALVIWFSGLHLTPSIKTVQKHNIMCEHNVMYKRFHNNPFLKVIFQFLSSSLPFQWLNTGSTGWGDSTGCGYWSVHLSCRVCCPHGQHSVCLPCSLILSQHQLPWDLSVKNDKFIPFFFYKSNKYLKKKTSS